MKLIFTKSNMPLSIAIRWALDEPVSHMAIVFDDKIVFHSNLLGTHVNWFNTFKKHAEIVFDIDCPLPLVDEEIVYQNCIARDEKPYDYLAFFKLGWHGLRRKYLGIPIPPIKDHWGNAFLCTELAEALPMNYRNKIYTSGIISPYQLYKELKE